MPDTFQWETLTTPLRFGFDPVGGKPVDPYWIWAELSQYASFQSSDGLYPVIFELSDQISPKENGSDTEAYAWGLLKKNTLNSIYVSKFGTSILEESEVKELVRRTESGVVARFQLCLGRSRSSDAPRRKGNFVSRPEAGLELKVAGIIDDGFPIAHQAFRPRNENYHPVIAIWDQSNPHHRTSQRHWSIEPITGYGSEISAFGLRRITGTIEDNAGNLTPVSLRDYGEAREREMYVELGRPQWGEEGRTHGACVMHEIAAPRTVDESATNTVLVQLPKSTVEDTSGGSLAFYVLDGVRYIYWRAREYANRNKLLLPINISFGSIAGPHDGTTILEKALDEICDSPLLTREAMDLLNIAYIDNNEKDLIDISVVVAAGNTAGKKIHGVQRLTSTQRRRRFSLMVPPANPRESYLELWIPVGVDLTKLIFKVTPPHGIAASIAANFGSVQQLKSGAQVIAGLVLSKRVCQSDGSVMGTMALLAVRATDSGSQSSAPFGIWAVEVESTLVHEVEIHAWVERNDNVLGVRSIQQAYLVEEVDPASRYLNDDSTLSSIANGLKTFVAGAYRISDSMPSEYSARGPVIGRQASTNFYYGPADEDMLQSGLQYPGFFTGSLSRMSGTSIAAPQITRWILDGKLPAKNFTVQRTVSGTPPYQMIRKA